MTLSDIVSRSMTSTNRSWRVIIILYVSTLLLAAALAFGFFHALSVGFGGSMIPDRMLEGFDSNVFNDFMRANVGFLAPYLTQITWLTIFWLVLNTLLGGGIVAALKRGSSNSFAEFFSDCGTYLVRFLLLLLLSAIIFLIIGTVWAMIVGVLYSAMTAGSLTEVPNVIGALVAAAVFLIPVIIIMMIIDYARVQIVVEDTPSVLSATWRSTKFVFRNFFVTFGWQLLMLLLLLGLAVLYWLIAEGFPMETGFGIFLAFVLQQISVASRIWARLVAIGGQVQLYESRNAVEIQVATVGFVPPVASPLPPMPSAAVRKGVSKKRAPSRRIVKRGKRK